MAQINIAGTLHNTEEIQGDALNSHVVAHADEILDATQEKKQSDVNADVDAALADRYKKDETYSKSQLDNLITTPNVQYVSVTATAQTTAVTDVLPATGAADTVYRVGSWDGSAFEAGKYSEYAWNGSAYQLLAVRSGSLDGVYDISANNLTEGQPTRYADLAAALGRNGANVPVGVRAGGMQARFINSTSGKYEQWRLMADTWSTTTSDWQGVDSTPTAGSQNLVTSGGVKGETAALSKSVEGLQQHFTEIGPGVNLYNEAAATSNHMLDSNGEASVSNSYFDTSDFIPVQVGKIYRTYSLRNNTTITSDFRCYALYDSNKSVVESVITGTLREILIPEGVAYMRVSVGNANNGYADRMVYEGLFTPAYEPFALQYKLVNIVEERLDALIDKEGRGNVFNASTIIEGYKFNDVDGRYFQSNSAFFTTQPISVRGYDKIIIYNNFSNTWPRNTILYKDGEILAQYNTATAQGQARPYPESSFILRDNSIGESGVKICYLDVSEADEIAMSFDNRVITGWEVDGQHKDSNLAIYRTCGEYFTPFIDTYKERTGNESISSEFLKDIRYYPTYFSGKKIAAIGDSITQGYTLVSYERPWPFFIGSNYNANMLNYGIGGSELAVFQLNELQEYDMTYNPMCIRYAGMDDDAELVLVAGGTNDWSHGHTALGQFGDTTVLTFYGALDVMCKGLLAKYPGKDIIFITPIKRWPNKGSMVYYEPNNLGYTLTDFVDAIKKVCAFYGIPVIDLYEKCPINPLIDEIYDAYLPDGTHPNFAGQRLMSRYITGGINGLISDIREL